MVNLDLVGRARAKGVRGIARAMGRMRPVQRHASLVSDKQAGCSVTFRENLTYRMELLSMLLDRISREQHRVAHTVNIFDMGGAKAELRRLFPHLKETYSISDAISTFSSVFLVSAVNSVVATLWSGFSRFLPESTRASVRAHRVHDTLALRLVRHSSNNISNRHSLSSPYFGRRPKSSCCARAERVARQETHARS